MHKLTNPYTSEKDTKVVMVNVSEADYYLVKSLRPEQGTISGVLGTLWKKLCEELRKREMRGHTHQGEFEEFVANCKITDGNGK